MQDQERILLRKLGEETIYSAKNHFKACDIRRQLITYTLWLCTFLNVIGLLDIDPVLGKVISLAGLLGTISLLLWNEGEGKNYRLRHKEFGERYLSLHKKIRSCYFLSECTSGQVADLSNQVRELDCLEKPDIPGIARRMAKNSIEKNIETDNWFLINEHK